jgi:thiamine-phosphate pyrophosphorylase
MIVTDRRSCRLPLEEAVRLALRGGATAVQVRDPGLPVRRLYDLVRELRGPVKEAGALMLVNHHVEVAMAAGAHGVHLKRVSLPVREARRLVGPDRIVGVSTHSEAEVEEAFGEGADYVVFGPVFSTPSKAGILGPRGPERYAAAARAAPGPVLALGGVSRETLGELTAGPLPGVALIRGVLAKEDPEAAAREIRAVVERAGDRS